MLTLAKDRLTKSKATSSTILNVVALVENFWWSSNALGSKIKAAFNCNEFVKFLDKKQGGSWRDTRRRCGNWMTVAPSQNEYKYFLFKTHFPQVVTTSYWFFINIYYLYQSILIDIFM